MTKFKFSQLAVIFAFLGLFGTSCTKDDPKPENEQEEINSMVVTFAPTGGGAPVVFSFLDADGPGGLAPVITAPALQANTTYNVGVTVAKVKNGVTENKTPEITAEGAKHQFFFIFNPTGLAQHSYSDTDASNRPIGLANRVVTGAAASGTLRLVLRHELNKAFAGLNASNYPQAGGETDIEVSFNVVIR
jgi:hypothetical protein